MIIINGGTAGRGKARKVLLLTEEKGNFVMQYGQYHGKGLFLRFSYWDSAMSMQAVCTHFSHKSHKTAGSLSLTSLIHILERCSEINIFSAGTDDKFS